MAEGMYRATSARARGSEQARVREKEGERLSTVRSSKSAMLRAVERT